MTDRIKKTWQFCRNQIRIYSWPQIRICLGNVYIKPNIKKSIQTQIVLCCLYMWSINLKYEKLVSSKILSTAKSKKDCYQPYNWLQKTTELICISFFILESVITFSQQFSWILHIKLVDIKYCLWKEVEMFWNIYKSQVSSRKS